MKKLLAIGFFVASIGQCLAMLDGTEKLAWVDGQNADEYEQYTQVIGGSIIQGSLPNDKETAQELKKRVWDEVRCGERNLLLMLTQDDAYVGHIFYSLEHADNIIRFATPGFANPAQTVSILKIFFQKLRTQMCFLPEDKAWDITFVMPEKNVPMYAPLIQLFGFERNDSIIPAGHEAKYYSEKLKAELGEFQGFILKAEKEIK